MKKNVFKNLTDVFAAVAVIFALIIVFLAYKDFKPTAEATKFYEVPLTAVYIGAAIAFFISFVANIASRRAPFIGLAFSLVPLWYLMSCMSRGVLKGENPIAYVLFAVIHVAGAAVYSFSWVFEQEKERSRAINCAVSASVISALHLGICTLAIVDPAYRYSFFYIRAGFIACAIAAVLCGFAALIRAKELKNKYGALIPLCVGGGISVTVWIFEFIF